MTRTVNTIEKSQHTPTASTNLPTMLLHQRKSKILDSLEILSVLPPWNIHTNQLSENPPHHPSKSPQSTKANQEHHDRWNPTSQEQLQYFLWNEKLIVDFPVGRLISGNKVADTRKRERWQWNSLITSTITGDVLVYDVANKLSTLSGVGQRGHSCLYVTAFQDPRPLSAAVGKGDHKETIRRIFSSGSLSAAASIENSSFYRGETLSTLRLSSATDA